MEKKIKIKTSDAHVIYGVLNTKEKKSNTLAVFVHGLTGHPNEHTFYNAAQSFPGKGVDVFRFALYTGEKRGRKLSECTISTHANDLDKVISYFRKKYQSIAVIGHSLGSPTILKSNTSKVDAIVLWDPSYLKRGSSDAPKKVKINDKELYLEEWGTEYLLNPAMYQEWNEFDGIKELPLVSKLKKPLKVIAAGKGILKEGSKKYIEVAEEPKDLVIIKNASHTFDEEGVEKKLLKETLDWVKRWSRRSAKR